MCGAIDVDYMIESYQKIAIFHWIIGSKIVEPEKNGTHVPMLSVNT